jgi:hypothetical protein
VSTTPGSPLASSPRNSARPNIKYSAMMYFRHMLEACHFIIFTDHKPISFAFWMKWDKCSPRQFNHPDFMVQFTTDIHLNRTSPTLSR